MNKIRLVVLCLSLTAMQCGWAVGERHPPLAAPMHKVYVGSLGTSSDAEYLRQKMSRRLVKSRKVVVVDDPADADAVLSGKASIWFRGYSCGNRRPSYLNRNCFPAYDAKMMLKLEDSRGQTLWLGKLKPRFWGSQYISDNVVNQAAKHIVEVLQ